MAWRIRIRMAWYSETRGSLFGSHSDSLAVALTRSPLFLSAAVVHGVVRRGTVRCDAVRCGCCGWRAYLTVFALSLSLRVPRVTIAHKRRMVTELHPRSPHRQTRR